MSDQTENRHRHRDQLDPAFLAEASTLALNFTVATIGTNVDPDENGTYQILSRATSFRDFLISPAVASDNIYRTFQNIYERLTAMATVDDQVLADIASLGSDLTAIQAQIVAEAGANLSADTLSKLDATVSAFNGLAAGAAAPPADTPPATDGGDTPPADTPPADTSGAEGGDTPPATAGADGSVEDGSVTADSEPTA